MAHIDYYFTVLSSWAYLAGNRLEEIAHKNNATITYKPVDIARVFTSTGGLLPKDRPPARVDYRTQELKRWANHLQMPISLAPAHWPTNAAPASYAIIAAQADGTGNIATLVQLILAAIWQKDLNIAEDDIVKSCLSEAGFDSSLADRGLLAGAETYSKNTDDAINAGVFGSPFYICDDGQKFWGQDRLFMLDSHLAAQ